MPVRGPPWEAANRLSRPAQYPVSMAKAQDKIASDHPGIAPLVGPDDPRRFTDSGIEIERVYDEEDVEGLDLRERLGEPGEYPFTRGIHPEMYRSRRWTMRQYAGYATAE